MPDEETLTPAEGTEIEITEPEAPAPAEPEKTEPDATALQAELEAERQAREAAERKFAESTREAQILAAKNKTLEERQHINQPTEDDLRKAFPTFEYMTDTEKDLARSTFVATQTAQELRQEKLQRDAEAQWNRDIETFVIADPKLQGREDEFRKFAMKKSHRGAPLDVLKGAFLYETPVVTPRDPAPGLEGGSGGTREPAKKGLSAEDLRNLRTSDYQAYLEYVKNNDIDLDL
jgi:chemotaxis protein histidine kinase CheA